MNSFSYLGFDFFSVCQKNQETVSSFLSEHPQQLCGYTHATLEAWKAFVSYDQGLSAPETMLIAYRPVLEAPPILLQPVGVFSSDFQNRIFSEAEILDYPLKIFGVNSRFLERHPEFVARFSVRDERNYANYIYRAEDLAKLHGRKYSKKRNHISQARSQYSWEVYPLAEDMADKCFSVLESIRNEENPVIEGMSERELWALETTLRNFRRLRQQGLLITVDGRPVAFSIFEATNSTTATIHFERALRSYKGLYQVINQETARVIEAQGFEFINREEDVGDAGLRAAKLSYHPFELITAWELTFRKRA
ncbi:MAG: phosphatidylglycerol lysyltransferase domain-containing protein [Acidobacteria bacterium]|nr:phosphatidylglycerol lysyltransferase domain-containing protein [Acidobacteriota bacterium]